jgi:hypothetical protein
MLCHNMLAQGEQLMAVSCESNWLQPAWFACMGCRYLIFELDNVQHLLQYCLGHRVCMVMFIPTAHWLVGVASTGKRLAWVGVELWPQSGAKISIDFQRKGWNLSKSLSYSGYSVFAGELSLPEPVSIHILGFWSTQARIRRSLSLLFGSIWFVSTGRCVPGKTPTRSKSAGHISHILLCVCEQPGHANALANKITSCPPKNNSLKKTII